ncbi:STAS/SEC14 domain-containing protein [Dongia sp. agr-C8]
MQADSNSTAAVRVFTRSNGGNRATLSIDGNFLRVDVAGEALDESIVDCFREAIAAGAVRANMVTLVDLSNFTGGVEWPAIHAIADLIPWGSEAGRPSRVAYVTKSAWFSALLKLVSVLFPKSQHRQFSGVHNAIQWLRQRD